MMMMMMMMMMMIIIIIILWLDSALSGQSVDVCVA